MARRTCPYCKVSFDDPEPSPQVCPACKRSLRAGDATQSVGPRDSTQGLQDSPPAYPAPAAKDLPGLTLIEQVGTGGFGSVYRALDSSLCREIAVKVLHARSRDNEARFMSEAIITGNLQHQNIIPVHTVGRDDEGRNFFTMKILEGRTLAAILRLLEDGDPAATAEFTLPRLLQILVVVCDAIAYAHSRGVLHRDLKPANIMLGAYGEVYVVDWGLAKVTGVPSRPDALIQEKPQKSDASVQFQTKVTQLGFHTMAGVALGTPGYMSPEQATGPADIVDARSDVYSLGVILYEVLTRRLPVAGETAAEIIQNTIAGALLPVGGDERGRRVPRQLVAVALKALALRPEDRYQSAEALGRDLRNFLEDREVGVCRDGVFHKLGRWARHNRTLASAYAIVCGVSIAAVIFVMALVSQHARTELAGALDRERLAQDRARLAEEKRHAEEVARQAEQQQHEAEKQKHEAERQQRELEKAQTEQLQRRTTAFGKYMRGIELAGRGAALQTEAEQAFTDAIQTDPSFIEAWQERAALRGRANDVENALDDYLQANRLHRDALGRDSAELLTAAGMLVWTRLHEIDRGRAYFEEAAKSDPNNMQARLADGVIRYLWGDRKTGLAVMRKLIAEYPSYWEAHECLGLMNLGYVGGDLPVTGGPLGVASAADAVESLNKAVALNPTGGRLYFYRGRAKLILYNSRPDQDARLLEDSLIDHALAVRLAPDTFDLHLYRLDANYNLSQYPDLASRYRCLDVCEEELPVTQRLLAAVAAGPVRDYYEGKALFLEARLRLSQKKLPEALAAIKDAVRKCPKEQSYKQLQRDIEARVPKSD